MSFEPGIPPPTGSIPLCIPYLSGNEWKYIKAALDSTYVSSVGPFVNRFEEEMSQYLDNRYAVATINGTAALHIALLVAGIKPDDEVLVATLTFIAPVNAIRYAGAHPVFVDCESEHLQMDIDKLGEWIKQNCRYSGGELINCLTGRRIKAIIPVHVLGHPVNMHPLMELAQQYGLTVIEDATESLGAKFDDRMVGTFGTFSCLSFNGNKLITTGGGGMLITDRIEYAQKARYLTTQAKDDPVEFVHHEIGYNYRLSNIQAALGCAQLEKIGEYICRKRQIAERYEQGLTNLNGITMIREASWAFSVKWMPTICIDNDEFGKDRHEMMNELDKRKIQTRPLWQPIHMARPYRQYPSTDCSVAEEINRRALCLPCSVGLTDTEQDYVIESIRNLQVKK
jgi:perosamine synthetase